MLKFDTKMKFRQRKIIDDVITVDHYATVATCT